MVIAEVPTLPNRRPSARCNYPRSRESLRPSTNVNLLPSAGLVPVMRLARRAGLESLVTRIVTVPGGAGANAAAKVASIAAGFLVALAHLVPLLTGHDDHRDAVTWLDTDDTMRETHGYAKQGVGYGYNKVKGLNALLGIVSTAASAPIIVAHRLRQGTVSSARWPRWIRCPATRSAP